MGSNVRTIDWHGIRARTLCTEVCQRLHLPEEVRRAARDAAESDKEKAVRCYSAILNSWSWERFPPR